MWSQIVLCCLVALAYGSTNSPAWKDNTEYVYLVNGRTLTSLKEASDQYSGIFLKAKLHIQPRSDGKLQARISEPQYAQIQSQLPDGWRSEIPDSHLSYKQLPLSQKPFEMDLEKGVIKSLIMEKDVGNWEANIIKSIVSQLQLDVQGQNAVRSPMNNFPSNDQLDGVFKTMEETVTGKTETLYEIHRLPEYLLQDQPWLAPVDKMKGDEDVIEIIKSKNFTNAEDRPSYHYGLGQINEDEPTSKKMGQFFIRESMSRAIVTGKLFRHVIQNSYTVNKIMVNPTFKNTEMGAVISMVNVTLSEVHNQQQQPQDLSNPMEIGDLVYTYETPFSKNNQVHQKLESLSKQDSSSEESSDQTWRRFRRSARQMISKHSDESSSEKRNQYQPKPQMSRAPGSPLLPSMMGYHGKSIKENRDFDIKQNVEKLVQEISEEMQKPEKILAEQTLNKYTILNTLVRLMNEDEIKSVAEQLHTQNQQGQERLAWVVYRDSVAEAGTGPAFLNIQQWIETKKIQKQEAAEVVATMARAVRVPTEEYMRKFFEIVKESQVKKQESLNETAILSFTDLVYKVYINKNESHNQYPVHAFGSFYTKEGREFVKSTVIPYLSQQLQEAVSSSDARKIHVYITALGNIGHQQILSAFEPYLEGDKQVSQFQRLMMVSSIRRLANQDPIVARSVCYKIYQNTAEIPEIRVVAVLVLMRTNPPVEMLQRMAQNTNIDAQEEVNAVVKSIIESASRLESSQNEELRNAAESAKHLLTRKPYGADQSFGHLSDYVDQQMGVEFKNQLISIGSSESNLPKGLKLSVEGQSNGMADQYFTLKGMISSIRELSNVLYRQTEQYKEHKSQRSQHQSNDNKWSSANIAQMMNYERQEREQLEAFILAEFQQIQKMWSFDNQTIEQLPEAFRELEQTLKNGKQINYNKLRQLDDMAISFPTEMGLPFLFTYDMPVMVRLEGKLKAEATPQISRNDKLHKPKNIDVEIDATMTVSGKTQSHLSFVTPFDHQVYTAGYDRNMQVHIPIKAKVEVDVNKQQAKIELEVQESQKSIRLLHFSTIPYTSRSDVMTVSPVALRPNTKVIKREQAHSDFDVTFGKKQTGLSFRAWGHHVDQSKTLAEVAALWQSEGISGMCNELWDKASLQNTEANIAFISGQSNVRKVTLRYRGDQEYKKQPEKQNEEEYLTLNKLKSKLESNEPKQRQEELIKHVGSGIQSAYVSGSEFTLECDGDKKYQHILGLANAKSNSDPKSRTLIYYKNKNQGKWVALEVQGKVPNTNGLDLTESLKTEPSAKYTVRAQYGESDEDATKVSAKFDLSRSQERKEYLINEEPLYRVCKQQMQQGNFQLSACQNMTIRANFLDDIKFQLQYENLNKKFEQRMEDALTTIRVFSYPMSETSKVSSDEENVVKGKIQFQPEDFNQVNVTVRAQGEETKFFNISIENNIAKTILVAHPVFHLRSRLAGAIRGLENFRPTCVIDKTAAQTFSNKTYPLSLDQQYTILMQYIPQNARRHGDEDESIERQLKQQVENYVVLAREASGQQKELIITFNHPETNGKTVQIDMKPQQGQNSPANPAARVTVDGQQMQFNDKESADLYNGFVQVYALPNGEVKLEIQDAFYLIFDGQRVKLTATSETLRDSISGLCGQFSGDKYEDFTVPTDCVVRDSRKFVESYQVENGQQRRQQRSGEQNQECVQKVLPLYADVISDRDAGRTEEQGNQGHRSTGTKLRNRYVEQDGEICFTIRPIPVCNSSARDTVSKNIPVHCVEGTKTAYYLKNQIDQGGNPDFSRKSETKKIRMEVARQCN